MNSGAGTEKQPEQRRGERNREEATGQRTATTSQAPQQPRRRRNGNRASNAPKRTEHQPARSDATDNRNASNEKSATQDTSLREERNGGRATNARPPKTHQPP